MELANDFLDVKNNYSKKINITKYTEGEKSCYTFEGVKDICELIIGDNDIEYNSIDKVKRKHFIINKKLLIAESFYNKDSDMYSKNFTGTIISCGFQGFNHLSSILYLNEYYKINCIIHNDNTGKYYRTSYKNYPNLICVYKNDGWFMDINNVPSNIEYNECLDDLSHIITIDCDMNIYRPYLLPITKYKVKELEELCKERKIKLLKESGKKKLKKELYDEINIYVLKNDP